MKVLVTGATGKVGQNFIRRFLAEPAFSQSSVRAFCHKRVLEEEARLEVIQGKMSSRQDVSRAVEGISHVVHLATCKETPDQIMDTTVKGLFWLLEGCRESPTFRRFIMVGGDSSMGHFFYPHPAPVTEQLMAHSACHKAYHHMERMLADEKNVDKKRFKQMEKNVAKEVRRLKKVTK